MIAKDFLKQIKKIDTQIKNKGIERKQLESMGVPYDDVSKDIDKLKSERTNIIATIEKLPEAEYDVLHMHYVQGMTLYEAAAERKISYSLATTIHGRGLKRLDDIVNSS